MSHWSAPRPHAIATLLLLLAGCGTPRPAAPAAFELQEPVGVADDNRTVLPVNQILTPAGRQVPLPGLRPQVLALHPSGRFLVASGKTHELIILDPADG